MRTRFCAHPLAPDENPCYNIGNIRAGPLVRLVRRMSIKGAFLSMFPPGIGGQMTIPIV